MKPLDTCWVVSGVDEEGRHATVVLRGWPGLTQDLAIAEAQKLQRLLLEQRLSDDQRSETSAQRFAPRRWIVQQAVFLQGPMPS